jgi:hypothetical protein
MADEYIRCPKDPNVNYLREICETVFRKEAYRSWCKTCQNLQEAEAVQKTAERAF